jgi:hypothetical protein
MSKSGDILAVLDIFKQGPRRMIQTKLVAFVALAAATFPPFAVADISSHKPGPGANRKDYAGDASCVSCHKGKSQSYQHNPHHLTSQFPTPDTVRGSFQNGSNTLTIVDAAQAAEPGLRFVMESRKDGLFETAQSGWGADVFQRSERIDLVTGSGARGQTYLYWQGNRLFELPVSYWSDGHRWINSPGYVDGTADFSRPVNPACLECHATYIRALSSDPRTNRYDRESLIPGIACESCHGPAANHVRHRTRHETAAKDSTEDGVLNPAKFSRDRQVDLCAECHNGIQREALAPTFSYVPGRPLSEYFKPLPSPDVEHPDVHGNQVGLLQKSKCYRSSPQMSCSTCHDVHTTGQSLESYSAKCLGCHNWQSCGVSSKLGHQIVNQCIDCHMPVEQTNVIVSQSAGKEVRATMRNHWIKVYPNAVQPAKAATAAARP